MERLFIIFISMIFASEIQAQSNGDGDGCEYTVTRGEKGIYHSGDFNMLQPYILRDKAFDEAKKRATAVCTRLGGSVVDFLPNSASSACTVNSFNPRTDPTGPFSPSTGWIDVKCVVSAACKLCYTLKGNK